MCNRLAQNGIIMTNQKRITIKDVAAAAGVSKSTASRVLNAVDRAVRISEPTKKLVRDAAERLCYQPNLFAAALRTQRTGVIGAIVRDINDPFLSQLAQALQRSAHAHGVELLLGHAAYDREIAARQQNVMRSWFDGLVMVGDMLEQQAVISKLAQQNPPDRAAAQNLPLLRIDDKYGIRLGVEYLLGLGHRRIALMGSTEYAGMRRRMNAFEELVAEFALEPSDFFVETCLNQRAPAVEATKRLLSMPSPPTAVFCMSDLMAMGALSGCWQAGWRVPDDISILGFDDIDEAAVGTPPLSTIRQPIEDMANESFRLLMELIDGKHDDKRPMPTTIKPELVIRSSCTHPKTKNGYTNLA